MVGRLDGWMARVCEVMHQLPARDHFNQMLTDSTLNTWCRCTAALHTPRARCTPLVPLGRAVLLALLLPVLLARLPGCLPAQDLPFTSRPNALDIGIERILDRRKQRCQMPPSPGTSSP